MKRARRNSGVTDTPAFRRWFGDSKVVDADGKPLVVYHAGFDALNSPKGAFRLSESGRAGSGIYFTPSRAEAERYLGRAIQSHYFAAAIAEYEGTSRPPAPAITAVYLSVQNPIVVADRGHYEPFELVAEKVLPKRKSIYDDSVDEDYVLKRAQKAGYDGIFVFSGEKLVEIVVFDPSQIKSATGNRGTFDPTDADIRHNPRALKPRGRTLVERGMPTKWWHGTKTQFEKIKPQSSGCVWLADRAGATEYATPYYSKPGHRWLLELDLAPDTSVVELADSSDPIVRAYIDMINDAAKYGRLPYTYEDWAKQDINFGILETERWSRGFFRKYGVDALIVRDVAGWGGHEAMPSLCLLNTKKIQQTQRHALNNPRRDRRNGRKPIRAYAPMAIGEVVRNKAKRNEGSVLARIVPGELEAVQEQVLRLSRDDVDALKNELNAADEVAKAQYAGMMPLYHGAPKSVATAIRQGGFRLTLGKRTSGFLGAEYSVQNQAVFLTPNRRMAGAFGGSRSDRGEGAEVLDVYADVRNPLDMTEWRKVPKPLRTLGERLVKEYYGGKPKQNDMFWLLDQPEFVKAIQTQGYDAVMFKESAATLAGMGLPRKGEVTVAVFDPARLHLAPPAKGTFASLLWHLQRRSRSNPRRARLNPDYPNVQILKGRIVSPEGSIPVRKIGEGAFSTVYLSEEAKPRVFAVTAKRAKEKEILSQAYALDPKNPHLPKVSRYGFTKTGKTVWTMPYYTMLGKAKEATEARNDAKALTTCRTSLLKRKSFHPKTSDEINEAIVACAESSVAVRPQLVRALDALRWAARLHQTYLFEFQHRNLAVDAKGNLILLDVLFDWKA